jgi:hypothetical protein
MPRREQAPEVQSVALRGTEGQALVVQSLVDDLDTVGPDFERLEVMPW